jgi:prolyl-tRNA synthetase
MFTLLVKDLYTSYKDLPLVLYQVQTKYRDEARPRAGLLRAREFVMKDAYTFDVDDAGLSAAYEDQRRAYQRVFRRLGLPTVIVSAMSGAMGGSRSEEFLFPTPVGEDTFVRSAGGYAANAEAVTTPVPAPQPTGGLPLAHVEDTPDTPTIASLVALANDRFPRTDRAWTASDTLKNVVLALVHPDGSRETVVVGVPGDREVDLDRLAASVSPADAEVAEDADFAAFPQLVRGYIGPSVLGVNAADAGPTAEPPAAGTEPPVAPASAAAATARPTPPAAPATGAPSGAHTGAPGEGAAAPANGALRPAAATSVASAAAPTAPRYLLDPRVVAGTRWITGANAPGRHVFDLVAGRDFAAAGAEGQPTIEAAEIREGDPAPDGSGPLSQARGIELGHIFQLGRKYSTALGLQVLDQNGKQVTVVMGSYGLGVTRTLAALAEANHDDKGLTWPINVAPAHVHVVATGKDPAVFTEAERIATELENRGVEVLYDDRPKVSPGVKFADAELLGVPFTVIVGRGLAQGVVEVRDRRAGFAVEVPVDDAVPSVAARVAEALAATEIHPGEDPQ